MVKKELVEIKYKNEIYDVLGIIKTVDDSVLLIKKDTRILEFNKNYILELQKNYEIKEISFSNLLDTVSDEIKNNINKGILTSIEEINMLVYNNYFNIELIKKSEYNHMIDLKLKELEYELQNKRILENINSNLNVEVVNLYVQEEKINSKIKPAKSFSQAFIDTFLLSFIVGIMSGVYALFIILSVLK